MANNIKIDVYKNNNFIETKKLKGKELPEFLRELFLNYDSQKEQREYKYDVFIDTIMGENLGTIQYDNVKNCFIFTLD